jgi:hypothetical protein
MNWKGYGRKQSWPNLRYYPSICLEGPRKTTKKPQSGQLVSRPGPPEYEAGVLTTQLQRSVLYITMIQLSKSKQSKSFAENNASFLHVLEKRRPICHYNHDKLLKKI